MYFFVAHDTVDFYDILLFTLSGKPIVKAGKQYLIRPQNHGIDVYFKEEKSDLMGDNYELNNTATFIDYTGKPLLEGLYGNTPIFSSEVANVTEYYNEKFGLFNWSEALIDQYGKLLVSFKKYHKIEESDKEKNQQDYFFTEYNNKMGLINPHGKEILPTKYYGLERYGNYIVCHLGSLLDLEKDNIQISDLTTQTFSKPFTATEITDHLRTGYFIYAE